MVLSPLVSSTEQKLKNLILDRNLQFGTTEAGRDWCIKALHPSDPLTEVRGIPDYQAQPTTLLNWQSQTSIRPAVGATGTWTCDMAVLTDPTNFCHYTVVDSVGTRADNIVNLQLGSGISPAASELATNAKAWRVAYMSVTIFQDGPSLANQGTVVAAQYPLTPEQVTVPGFCRVANTTCHMVTCPITKYMSRDVPAYERLQTMPNSYFGNSKSGLYMPIKLDPAHVEWKTVGDRVHDGTAYTTDGGTGVLVPVAAVAPSAGWPYAPTAIVPSYFNSATNNFQGNRLIGPLSINVGGACFKNLSVDTGLSVVIRMGLEVQAHAGSIWGPYLRLAPPTDLVALSTYYAISRELKDAYPEDFNSLAKLWDVIKGAAKVVGPVLPLLGPIGSAIHAGGSLVGNAIDSVASRKTSKELEKDKPPAAAVERAREALHQRTVRKSTKKTKPTVRGVRFRR